MMFGEPILRSEQRIDNNRLFGLAQNKAEDIKKEAVSQEAFLACEDAGQTGTRGERFLKFHPRTKIENDLRYLKDRKKKFAEKDSLRDKYDSKKAKEFSDVFEVMMFDQIENCDWFGPNAFSIKTSEYDDIANGVDGVVEFINEKENGENEYLAMGIDVTYSGAALRKKIENTLADIVEGRMARVDYFVSGKGECKPLKDIPRALVAINPETIREISGVWATGRDTNDRPANLSRHGVQIMVLRQLVMQFEFFCEYAESFSRHEIANSYRNANMRIKEILKTKKEEGIYDDSWANDNTDNIFKEIIKENKIQKRIYRRR